MKNFVILLLLISCSIYPIKKTENVEVVVPIEKPVVSPNPVLPAEVKPTSEVVIPGKAPAYEVAPAPSPTAEGKFTVNIQTINYNANQQAKVNEAAGYIRSILNSEEYKQEVLGFTYKLKLFFIDNKNMSNEQIYNHLKGGAEALNPIINYQMDITLKMYYKNNSTVGYTYPSDTKIYTNSKFHNLYTACQVASNTTHEWTHKMGFPHAQKWSESRDYSVPYGHNRIVEKLCPLAKLGKLTPLKAEILPLTPVPN